MAADETSLAAALRTYGKARVAPGTVNRLTRTLLIKEKPSDSERKNCHCECRRLRPRRERQSAGGACAAGGRREG